jgi:hypothetical protein
MMPDDCSAQLIYGAPTLSPVGTASAQPPVMPLPAGVAGSAGAPDMPDPSSSADVGGAGPTPGEGLPDGGVTIEAVDGGVAAEADAGSDDAGPDDELLPAPPYGLPAVR